MDKKKIHIIMFPAMRGDCTLIEAGSLNLLIDLGYKTTYSNFLKAHLVRMAESGNKIDICVVSHIDADHIEGAAEGLFLENKESSSPQIIPVNEVWYNSYRHLPLIKNDDDIGLTDSDRSILEAIAATGLNPSEEYIDSQVSIRQGVSLAALLLRYNYLWNSCFSQGGVQAPKAVQLGGEVLCHIISPVADNLKNLSAYWRRELQRQGFESELTDPRLFEEAYQSWADMQQDGEEVSGEAGQTDDESVTGLLQIPFKPDTSITNASSIAFILEYNGKKVMLLADSSPSVIVSELKRLYPECSAISPVWFECIKVAHHGAFKNNSPDLLQITDSDCYLFSTDGRVNDHPDAATIAWIISRPRRGNIIRRLYFNYSTKSAVMFDREDWKVKYGYETHINDTEGLFKVEI